MALKLPNLKIFSKVDAKSRIFLLFAGVVGLSLLIYMLVRFLGGDSAVTGPTTVANAPAGLVSVPGSELNPQYAKILEQENTKRAERGITERTAAVPTLMNVATNEGNCTVLCPSDDNVDITKDLNDLVARGILSQEEANQLADLAAKNVSVDEYAAALDALVKAGKLTPEQARLLLEKYKKQHANALIKESASVMDAMIQAGQLPLSTANELLELQKKNLTPAEYAAELERLVREGKLTPEAAAKLLAQYTQQKAKEAAKVGMSALRQMASAGQITPDVLKTLEDLQSKNVPLDEYAAQLEKLVAAGKMTPATARKALDLYRAQRLGALDSGGPIGALLAKGGASADFARGLLNKQANNVSLNDYANELKRGVAMQLISPDDAKRLYEQYQAVLARGPTAGIAPTVEGNIPFNELQRRIQEQGGTGAPAAQQQFAAPPPPAQTAQAVEATIQERQQRIQQLLSAMSGQAQNLLAAWQPPMMVHKEGTPPAKETTGTTTTTGGTEATSGVPGEGGIGVKKPVLIKAGTIIFGVLDTAVDSDYPDTPVMVSIIEGKYKGAKLLGKLSLAQGGDKVSLAFNLMDMDNWTSAKSVNAFAVDPDTARTVMASEVDNHYLERYGAILATSFLQGYSTAITNAGTSTTGIFGTSTTTPELSPSNKIAVALGQIGTNLSSVAAQKVNMPPTVKVNSGVGLGILFTTEVTE